MRDQYKDVHTEHCCYEHGCKYGNEDCSVAKGVKPQSSECERCFEDTDRDDEVLVSIGMYVRRAREVSQLKRRVTMLEFELNTCLQSYWMSSESWVCNYCEAEVEVPFAQMDGHPVVDFPHSDKCILAKGKRLC